VKRKSWKLTGKTIAAVLLVSALAIPAGPAGGAEKSVSESAVPAGEAAGPGFSRLTEVWDPFAWMEEFRREMDRSFAESWAPFRRRARRETEPFGWLREFQEEMDRFFEKSRSPWQPDEFARIEPAWKPRVDIREDEDKVVVRVDLPGIDRENLTVTVEGNLLTLEGERKEETELREENYLSVERHYGSFRRVVTLPPTVDTDNPTSSYEDGVLEIRFPKTDPPAPKQLILL
jgi:HSP20 family protein